MPVLMLITYVFLQCYLGQETKNPELDEVRGAASGENLGLTLANTKSRLEPRLVWTATALTARADFDGG